MNIFLKKQLGFTMIELLVVIAIISFIASAAIYSVQAARIKARDTKRIADLSQIRKALDMYFSDNNKYPNTNDNWARSSAVSGQMYTNWENLKIILGPYMPKLPNDPINSNQNTWTGGFAYMYRNLSINPKTYDLIAYLEDANNSNICKFKCQTFYTGGSVPWCSDCPPNGWENGGPGIYANH